jgi:hypothetical protein
VGAEGVQVLKLAPAGELTVRLCCLCLLQSTATRGGKGGGGGRRRGRGRACGQKAEMGNCSLLGIICSITGLQDEGETACGRWLNWLIALVVA